MDYLILSSHHHETGTIVAHFIDKEVEAQRVHAASLKVTQLIIGNVRINTQAILLQGLDF